MVVKECESEDARDGGQEPERGESTVGDMGIREWRWENAEATALDCSFSVPLSLFLRSCVCRGASLRDTIVPPVSMSYTLRGTLVISPSAPDTFLFRTHFRSTQDKPCQVITKMKTEVRKLVRHG